MSCFVSYCLAEDGQVVMQRMAAGVFNPEGPETLPPAMPEGQDQNAAGDQKSSEGSDWEM